MNIYSNPGKSEPLGCTRLKNGKANFALLAPNASKVLLCLFLDPEKPQNTEIPLYGPTDGVWHIEIDSLPKDTVYGYRVENAKHPLTQTSLLCDPYARALFPQYQWADFSVRRRSFLCKTNEEAPFDWQNTPKPNLPREDLIIYEMHVRGFTKHPSSKVEFPGTYAGMIEKISYLQKLGITAIELLPIFEFDETFPGILHPEKRLPNYWGYHPIHFFSPMNRFAANPNDAVREFKMLVRECHKAKIEVILDVVYNHTGEGKELEICFKGIDRSGYYLIDEKGNDLNYSGCGNTFHCNSSLGIRIILDSLRYWAEEMQVDGFRFDLASILTRGSDGKPLANPPILEAIAKDPVLSQVKLIAEPWDAAGLHQTAEFPKWGSWSVWNDAYRDCVRNFVKGTDQQAGAFANALCGSESLLGSQQTPLASINFITAHDGFCLRDLVTYQRKHNVENGEDNRDGSDANHSWNCGHEGPSESTSIQLLREKQMRNFLLALFVSQGIPMLLMGDEIGQTRFGNNNPYNQDNSINWFDWTLCEKQEPIRKFTAALIALRKNHPSLRQSKFLTNHNISWHGSKPNQPNWGSHSRFVACTISGDPPLYLAFNAGYEPITISLPHLEQKKHWYSLVQTNADWESSIASMILPASTTLAPYSALLAEGR